MRAKNLALRVLSTAAMLSIVTSIAAPAFAATYYINDGSVDVKVSEDGVVTVEQGGVTYKDGLGSVVIRGGTRSEGEKDDRTEAGASPATQEADGSNAPAGNETEAPKSENTAGDAAPKQETTAAGERKEGTPQQEPTEEEEEEEEQQEPTEEKVTPGAYQDKARSPQGRAEAFRRAGRGAGGGRGRGADRSLCRPAGRCPHSTGGQQQHQHPRKADRKRHHHCQQLCRYCQAGFFVCAGQCEY